MDPELFRVTVVTLESDNARLVFTQAILQLNLVTSVSSKRSLPLSFTISKKLCLKEASCSGEGGSSWSGTMVQLKRHRMKVPDEVPRHYPLDTRAEFRALYPAQAVL